MCSSQQTVEAKHNKKILETMQKILKSSTNELGEGVEKRADWLLNDIRQMNTSTATLNGGSLLRSGQLVDSHLHNKKKNDRTRSQLENIARSETALISINPTRVSTDLQYELSRRYNKGRPGRDDGGWGTDDNNENDFSDGEHSLDSLPSESDSKS